MSDEQQAPERIWLLKHVVELLGADDFVVPPELREHAFEYIRADLAPVAQPPEPETWTAIADARPNADEDVLLFRPSDKYCQFWIGRINPNPAVDYAWLTVKGEMPLGEFTHWKRLREPRDAASLQPPSPQSEEPITCMEDVRRLELRKPYKEHLREHVTNAEEATGYLSACFAEGPDTFALAVKDVWEFSQQRGAELQREVDAKIASTGACGSSSCTCADKIATAIRAAKQQ